MDPIFQHKRLVGNLQRHAHALLATRTEMSSLRIPAMMRNTPFTITGADLLDRPSAVSTFNRY
jgi:hypothetical protein